jgi:hypothetical protein
MTASLERELGSGGDLLTSALARAAALERARARCRGVSTPSRVWRRPDGVVAYTVDVAKGASVAEASGSGRLCLGQVIAVGVGVANALAAMHAERVAHGDVSAANVMVDGVVATLVDTMGALADERGTPGFVAPERDKGASPAADVFSLGMLLRSLADDDAAPVIEAWTAPLVAEDPMGRPAAAHAAAALAQCTSPEPIAAPAAPVAAAMRSSLAPRTVKRPADRWWRAERNAIRLSPLAAVMAVGAVAGAGLVPSLASAHDDAQIPAEKMVAVAVAEPTIPVSATTRQEPEDAARSLTQERVDALAAADGRALLAVSAPGSPSALADRRTADRLDSRELCFTGLSLADVSARLVREVPGGAVVEVTTTLSGYSVGRKRVPAAQVTAVLELTLTQKGWLVERTLPPS